MSCLSAGIKTGGSGLRPDGKEVTNTKAELSHHVKEERFRKKL
jgi:hypothetical protein